MIKQSHVLIVATALCFTTGCQSARRKTADLTLGTVAILAEAIVNGVFDDDETVIERQRRETNERKWKQHWRNNPNENPAMTAAYKDDYE